jgi:hypothetical protein
MLELLFERIEEPRDLGGAATSCANLPHPAPRHSAHAGLPKSFQQIVTPGIKSRANILHEISYIWFLTVLLRFSNGKILFLNSPSTLKVSVTRVLAKSKNMYFSF